MELFKRLKEADDPQPALAARELAAFVCKADKNKTAEWAHIYLDTATIDFAHLMCDKHLEGEPLAYLLGEWDFYGLTFCIDRSVLIPRPETERLCELVIERARTLEAPRILDLCCGSGCIGIAVAHEVETARVAGVDISEGALRVTRENARRLGVQARYAAVNADVMRRPLNNMGQFDILVSNPPYITAAEMRELDHSVIGFEPYEALFGGEDGLDFYRAICSKWGELLAPNGMILFECGDKQPTAVASILEDNRFVDIGITEDAFGVPRIVFGYNTPSV